MRKTIFIFLLSFLLVITAAMAAPVPQTVVSSGSEGLDIKFPLINALREDGFYAFEFHVTNKNGGLAVTNANCTLHIYNSSGNHIYDSSTKTVDHVYDYGFDVAGTTFADSGYYHYIVYCNATVQEEQTLGGTLVNVPRGGFAEHSFYVNKNGSEANDNWMNAVIYALIAVMGLFAYLYSHTDTADKWIKLLFLFSSLIVGMVMFSMQDANFNGSSQDAPTTVMTALTGTYELTIWVFRIALVVILLYVFYSAGMNAMGKKVKEP